MFIEEIKNMFLETVIVINNINIGKTDRYKMLIVLPICIVIMLSLCIVIVLPIYSCGNIFVSKF